MNKVPLRYQATEYDCGSTAVINAINYVCDFSEIPAFFLKIIYAVCLNECGFDGTPGSKGTSPDALRFLCSWFNDYSFKTGFPMRCFVYEDNDVTFGQNSFLLDFLKRPDIAVVLMCVLRDEHYVTLTDYDGKFVYFFDPYYWNFDFNDDKIVRIDFPFKANRKVPVSFFESTDGLYYALKPLKKKYAFVFERIT